MTPEQILAAKTPGVAAKRLHKWLQEWSKNHSGLPENISLWDPERSSQLGYGKHWSIAWEEGPFEWTMIAAGCELTGPQRGVYSALGPFPGGIHGPGWYCEQQNHWMITFVKD